MNTRNSPKLLLVLALGPGCGPQPIAEECITIDEHLGFPASRQWCDEYYQPWDDPSLAWNGQPPVSGLPVCLPPQSDGSCQVCPLDEVVPVVEAQLKILLAQGEPQCQLEHWELGCMRTKESVEQVFGPYDDYCCFEVAIWGPGCAEDGAPP